MQRQQIARLLFSVATFNTLSYPFMENIENGLSSKMSLNNIKVRFNPKRVLSLTSSHNKLRLYGRPHAPRSPWDYFGGVPVFFRFLKQHVQNHHFRAEKFAFFNWNRGKKVFSHIHFGKTEHRKPRKIELGAWGRRPCESHFLSWL